MWMLIWTVVLYFFAALGVATTIAFGGMSWVAWAYAKAED